MPAIVGTDAASSHVPNPISTPNPFAISAPIGLAAIAVSQSAEERLRLTMPENIRKLPRRRRLSSPGFAPAASASENASGKMTPERAVLLGKAGAMRPSTRKMLYDNPSVDRPKRLTRRWPIRAPRPHFTTERATRKASTMRRMVPFANPAYAFAGDSSPVSTAAATAMTDAVKMGNALATTKTMAPANSAKSRHA